MSVRGISQILPRDLYGNIPQLDRKWWKVLTTQKKLSEVINYNASKTLNIWITFEVKIEYDLSGSMKRVMESYQATHLYPPYISVKMSHTSIPPFMPLMSITFSLPIYTRWTVWTGFLLLFWLLFFIDCRCFNSRNQKNVTDRLHLIENVWKQWNEDKHFKVFLCFCSSTCWTIT